MTQQFIICANCSRILGEEDRIIIDDCTFTNLHPTFVYTCPHCGHIEASNETHTTGEDAIPS